MSASVMHTTPLFGGWGRMHSVEELDSSLTLLSRHNILTKTLPITPPGTPVAQSPEQYFEYTPSSPSNSIPPNTPVTPGLESVKVTAQAGTTRVAAANGAPFPNIDNKIEQAMDLVKTHLTFAVREEIEVLRQNIVELEQKLTHLENENQFLRQYAPPEVVANLAPLTQQRPSSQSLPQTQNTSQAVIATPSTTVSKIPTSGFCPATFANTLNNVVADVRQQIRNPNPQ